VPGAQVGGQEAPGLLGQIDEDRAAFEHRDRRASAWRIMVDDGRHAVVRADREERRIKLLAAPDIDRLQRVGQAAFFKHDGHLPPVGCRPVVQVDHRYSSGRRVERSVPPPRIALTTGDGIVAFAEGRASA
jgi:hypothetical protein